MDLLVLIRISLSALAFFSFAAHLGPVAHAEARSFDLIYDFSANDSGAQSSAKSSFVAAQKFRTCQEPKGVGRRLVVRLKSISELETSGLQAEKIDQRRLEAKRLLQSLPIQTLSTIEQLDLVVINIPLGQDIQEIVAALERSGHYSSIREDCLMKPAFIPDDTAYATNQSSYLGSAGLNFEAAWSVTQGDDSVTIAILDTGIQSGLTEFSGRMVPGYNSATCAATATAGCGNTEPITTMNSCRTHGTRVAGVAAATGHNASVIAGINWAADIMPIRISNDADCGAWISDMAEAVIWASEQGADVINMSYSGAYDPEIQDAAEIARRNGSLLVMAAGNDAEDMLASCLAEGYSATECSSAAQSDVLIVGSIDGATTSASLSSFSNFGSMVDLVAPGEDIAATDVDGSVVSVDGTSFASPIVAGLASLLLSVNSKLSPSELAQLLFLTAADMGTAGEDDTFGAGLIQPAAAVDAALLKNSALDLADNRKLDFTLPHSPFKFWKSERRSPNNPRPKFFAPTSKNQGLISMGISDLQRRDFYLAEIPSEASIGVNSLFFRTNDGSEDFVFTDKSRKNIFFGTTNASGTNIGDAPVIRTLSCGSFSEISAIHLTETATGATHRLIVADRGANRVFSYVLDRNGPQLCTSEAFTSIASPVFIKSLPGASPRIFVGASDADGLRLHLLNATTLAPLTSSANISSNPRARFGISLADTTDRQLILPIQFADDATHGADFIRVFDENMAVVRSLQTCRSPVDLMEDFEGLNRYRYVFCPIGRRVNVYDTAWNLMATLPAPQGFKRMAVHSDGVNRHVTMLGSTKFLTRYSATVAEPIFSESTHQMPAIMDDMAALPSDLSVVTLNKTENSFFHFDISPLATQDTLKLPSSVSSLVNSGPHVSHFVSSSDNMAYTLEELFNGAWKIRLYDVGSFPIQLLSRNGFLFSLNRDSDSLSVINLSTRAVTSLATQDRPVSMALDTGLNFLWTANQGTGSYSRFNITSEVPALIDHTALPFDPAKVLYSATNDTLYFAGENSSISIDGSSNALLTTQSLPGTFTDMALISGAAWITSQSGLSVSTLNRSTLSSSALSSNPHLLTSNQSVGVIGQLNDNQLLTSQSSIQTVEPFTHLFSTLTNLFVVNSLTPSLKIFPFASLSNSTPSGIQKTLPIRPERFSVDGLGNAWLADSRRLQFQRIDSDFQVEQLQNLTLNRPTDVASWGERSRQYYLLRNLSAIAVWDASNNRLSFYATCGSARKILLDTLNENLFVLCGELSNIARFRLKSNGDILSQSLIATPGVSFDMALDRTRERLFVTHRTNNSISIFDTGDLALAPITIATENDPTALAIDTATGNAFVFHAGPQRFITINGNTLVKTTTKMTVNNISKAAFNGGSNEVYALNLSTGALHYDTSAVSFVPSNLSFLDPALAEDLAISAAASKIYVTYPQRDTLRIFEEDGQIRDLTLNSNPSQILVLDDLNRAYVSNHGSDTISVINLVTDAILSTVTLAAGCGPKKMSRISLTGTDYVSILCEKNDSVQRMNATTYALSTTLALRITD